jgi:monothiol glutaredoxin
MVYQDEKEVQKAITDTVASNPIILFVKGTPEAPQCGFSKGVMDMFQYLGVPFQTVNVLSDPLLREGIKQYTQWPTIPQIFIKGEFIGGFDIVRDLFERGELENMVKSVTAK